MTSMPCFKANSACCTRAQDHGKLAKRKQSSQACPKLNVKKTGPPNSILKKKDLERLCNAARVLTVDERLEMLEKQEREAQRFKELEERARLHFFQIDGERGKLTYEEKDQTVVGNQGPREIVCFAKKVDGIVSNVKLGPELLGQTDQRRSNESVQQKQSQYMGKQHIAKMTACLSKSLSKGENQREVNVAHAQELRAQMIQREYQSFLETERLEEEARICREAAAAYKRQVERDALVALERKKYFRAELDRTVEMSNRFKKIRCEKEHEEDLQREAFLREKHEREQRLKQEKENIRREAERQRDRMFSVTEKQMQAQADHKEMSNALEEKYVEREKQIEEEKAKKRRAQMNRELKETLRHQMEEKKTLEAMKLARDERDFNMMLEKYKNDEALFWQKRQKHLVRQSDYRKDLIRQWSQKTMEHRRLKDLENIETSVNSASEKKLQANIERIREKKLATLRKTNQSPRIINEIDRQIKRAMKEGIQTCNL